MKSHYPHFFSNLFVIQSLLMLYVFSFFLASLAEPPFWWPFPHLPAPSTKLPYQKLPLLSGSYWYYIIIRNIRNPLVALLLYGIFDLVNINKLTVIIYFFTHLLTLELDENKSLRSFVSAIKNKFIFKLFSNFYQLMTYLCHGPGLFWGFLNFLKLFIPPVSSFPFNWFQLFVISFISPVWIYSSV